VALHRSAVRVDVHAVPVHVGLTCAKDDPVVAGDDEPEVVAEVDRGCVGNNDDHLRNHAAFWEGVRP